MTRILIVDDNSRVRTALRLCLQTRASWEVCGEAEDGQQAVEMARNLKPDVVLLDYAMPMMNGIEAARRITTSASIPDAGLILFTMFASTELAKLAEAAGVHTVISKDVGGIDELVHAIERLTADAA